MANPATSQATSRAGGKFSTQLIKSTSRDRVIAGILSLVYAALMALASYLESIRIEDYWPSWALWTGALAGTAIMLVLPILAVKYLFGINLDSLWRFSLRKMLLAVFWISLFVWFMTEMQWGAQRRGWLSSNRATARSTEGIPPFGLRLLGDPGQSRIEIKNATRQQIAEAQRLFPEATVVATGESPEPEGGK